MRERVIGFVATIMAATTMLAACATTTQQGAVGVERRPLLLVSSIKDLGIFAQRVLPLYEQAWKK